MKATAAPKPSRTTSMQWLVFGMACFIVSANLGLWGCSKPELEKLADASAGSANRQSIPDSKASGPAAELLGAIASLELEGAKVVLDASQFPKEISFAGVQATDEMAAQLQLLTSVEKLTVRESSISLDGWKKLASLRNLQQLDLRDCPIGNDDLVALVSGTPKLRALKMNGQSGVTTVDDVGLGALSQCPDLKALAIDGLWVTVDGYRTLQGNKKLAELYAAGTAVDDEVAQLLAAMPALRKLRLAQTTIGTEGLQALSRLPLEDLDVSECSGVNDESLVEVGKMKSLKRLNLWRDTVGDEGMPHLSGLTQLQWLNLDNTHLRDAGLPSLSSLMNLTFLHLGSTGITDAGMPALKDLKSLKDLKVTRTAVTPAGAAIVQEAIPGLDIQLEYVEGQ